MMIMMNFKDDEVPLLLFCSHARTLSQLYNHQSEAEKQES